jgi:hypothetical protein
MLNCIGVSIPCPTKACLEFSSRELPESSNSKHGKFKPVPPAQPRSMQRRRNGAAIQSATKSSPECSSRGSVNGSSDLYHRESAPNRPSELKISKAAPSSIIGELEKAKNLIVKVASLRPNTEPTTRVHRHTCDEPNQIQRRVSVFILPSRDEEASDNDDNEAGNNSSSDTENEANMRYLPGCGVMNIQHGVPVKNLTCRSVNGVVKKSIIAIIALIIKSYLRITTGQAPSVASDAGGVYVLPPP